MRSKSQPSRLRNIHRKLASHSVSDMLTVKGAEYVVVGVADAGIGLGSDVEPHNDRIVVFGRGIVPFRHQMRARRGATTLGDGARATCVAA